MPTKLSTRLSLLVWLLSAVVLAILVYYPVSNRLTRGAELVLGLLLWRGLLALAWKHRWWRFGLLTVTGLGAAFLMMPGRDLPPAEELRSEYVQALRTYEGVTYHWGGEAWNGIDCSGLVRCGLMKSFFLRGLRTADAGLMRRAISLWWNDTSARALGEGYANLTQPVGETPALNGFDHSQFLPGDLAVTANGVHIMAYLGGGEWLEADPAAWRVIAVRVPATDVGWFSVPMRLVRWSVLAPGHLVGAKDSVDW